MTSVLRAGQYLAQIAILDDDGYPMGTLITPNAPVHGTVYSPYVIPAVVEYTPAQATYQSAYSRAGMKLRGRRSQGATDYGIGSLTLSEYDDVFAALVLGGTVDTTSATGVRIRGKNKGRVQQRNFMLALTTGAVPSDSAVAYDTIVLLNCYFEEASGGGTNQSSGENTNNLVYNIYVNMSRRNERGQLFSAATTAPDGDQDTESALYYSEPMMFTTYIDDNSATTFALPYAPSSTEHAGVINMFYNEGIDLKAQVSGISGSTVTIAAQADNSRWVNWFASTAAL